MSASGINMGRENPNMFRKKQTWAGERKLGLVHHNMGANNITGGCEKKHKRERGTFCPKEETSAGERKLQHESRTFCPRSGTSARKRKLLLESIIFCPRSKTSARRPARFRSPAT